MAIPAAGTSSPPIRLLNSLISKGGRAIAYLIPLLLLFSLFILFPAGHAAEKGPKGTVRVGIFPFAPLNYIDEDGQAQGLNPDLLREIVRDERWQVQFVPGSWAEGLERLQNKEIDLMVSVAYSEERGKTMDFTYESVAELWGQVFIRPEGQSKNISDLAGQRVALMRKDISGSNFISTAKQLGIECKTIEFDSHAEVLAAVQKGAADAGVAPQHFGLRHADEYGLVASTIMFSPFSIYFACKKGAQHELLSHIDAHLSRWKRDKNSYYYQRLNHWMTGYSSNLIPPWALPVFLGILAIGLVFAGFSLFLKNAVIRKTKELSESEQYLRSILQTTVDGFLVFDIKGRIIDANEAYCRMSGYSRDQLLDLTIADLEAASSPEAIKASGERIVAKGSEIFRTRHRRNVSGIVDVELSVTYLPMAGGKFICFCRDITENKKAEDALIRKDALLRAMLRNLPFDFWARDNNQRIIVQSDESIHLWGDLTHTDLPEVFFEQQTLDCWHSNNRRVLAGETVSEDCSLVIKTGERRDFHNIVAPIREGEEILGILGVNIDITERKRAEEERKNLQEQLIKLQKTEAIGTLAGGIAHDFNNILGAILGYAEMARDDSSPGSAAAKYMDKVLAAGDRAANLVKQILAFSRQADAVRLPLHPALIVKETIKLLRPTLPSTITIRHRIKDDIRPILADPTQVHQILMNLCTNAFHAMEQSGGTLDISLENRELTPHELLHQPDVRPGRFIELAIGDSGSGITPEIRDKIFDPYFTTKEVGKGTGMGLAIAHGIVTSYGGFLTCESSPGAGTVFRVLFPATEQNIVPEALAVTAVAPGSERILLVDDEAMLAEWGKTTLEHLGYTVTMQTSSEEALKVFENNPDLYDAVITDQTMPVMTGSELASRMLSLRPGLPIILCTGYSSLISEEQAKDMGIKGFALKPLVQKDIAALLRTVLDQGNPASQPTSPAGMPPPQ